LHLHFDTTRTKLELKARKCIFLGYKNGIKGYIVLDTNNREIFINRNVIFYEKIFPYKMAHNYAFDNQEQDENFIQRDFDFLKEPLDHNIDNNNIETKIDRNR